MKAYFLFIFDSTHFAIKAQKLLKDFDVTIMPALREISASCGMALKIAPEHETAAVERMKLEGQGFKLYYITQEEKKNVYTLIHENTKR